MPSDSPRPEKVGLDAEERHQAHARDIVANALLRCADAGWLVLDEAKTPVTQYHDLHDSAAAVVRRLSDAGLLTRAGGGQAVP